MVESRHIDIAIQNKIMQIGINRPDKKNALSADMYDAMRTALESARTDPDVNAVVLHGTPDAFSSGNDLKGFDNRDPDKPSAGMKFLLVLESFNKAASNVVIYAMQKAEQMAQKPQQALLLTKKLLKQENHESVVHRMGEELRHFRELLQTPESIEIRAKLKTIKTKADYGTL